ncbi:MAG: hypothetical protein ACR2P5_05280 [Gammaproteobacteria bacterium]
MVLGKWFSGWRFAAGAAGFAKRRRGNYGRGKNAEAGGGKNAGFGAGAG